MTTTTATRGRPMLLSVLIVVLVLADIVVLVARHGGSTDAQRTYRGPVVSDAAGQFSARFPATPVQVDPPRSQLFGVGFDLHLASTRSPVTTEVEAIDFVSPVLTGSMDELRSSFDGFASTSGFTLVGQRATTFRGHDALVGTFVKPNHSRFSLLIVRYDDRTAYLIGADSAYFNELATSFRATATGSSTASSTATET